MNYRKMWFEMKGHLLEQKQLSKPETLQKMAEIEVKHSSGDDNKEVVTCDNKCSNG